MLIPAKYHMQPSLEFFREIDQFPKSIFVVHEKEELRLPEHHHDKGHLVYIEGGVAYIHLTDRSLIIPARHYVWVPARMKHFFKMHKSAVSRILYFYTDDDDSHVFYSQLGIYPINALLMQMLIYSERWSGDIVPVDKAFHFLAGIKYILPEISQKALPIALPTTENDRIHPVLDYINEHILELLSLKSVSRETGFSERTLSRLFQATMNTSFLQYCKLLRMVKAIEMMLQTNLSISEIAYALGYNSVSAFSNIFFQLTKTRPSEFVKQLKS